MNYINRVATMNDLQDIVDLYQSHKGAKACTWNEHYPTDEEATRDIQKELLYCICDEQDKVIAVASGVTEEEDDGEAREVNFGWSDTHGTPCDIARVGVSKSHQNEGLGKKVVQYLIDDLKEKGYTAFRLIVSKTNPNAVKLYKSLGFTQCGEVYLYNVDWYCYELLF